MPRAKPTQGTIIKQPSGSYRAFFLLDGKRLTKTFPNNAQAVEWLNGVAEQKANGLTYNVSKVTVLLSATLQLLGQAYQALRAHGANLSLAGANNAHRLSNPE